MASQSRPAALVAGRCDEVARANSAKFDELYAYGGLQRLVDFDRGELNSATTADRQFVWGLRYVDDLVLRDKGSERLYALQNALFNVVALADDTGAIVARFAYKPYGLSEELDPDYTGYRRVPIWYPCRRSANRVMPHSHINNHRGLKSEAIAFRRSATSDGRTRVEVLSICEEVAASAQDSIVANLSRGATRCNSPTFQHGVARANTSSFAYEITESWRDGRCPSSIIQ